MADYDYIELECPNCHAPLRGRAGANLVACEFCGTQVQITRKQSHRDGAIPVRDASGRTLLHMMVPFDWDVSSAVLDMSAASGEWPWQIRAEITDHKGSYIRYQSPLEFCKRGAAMARLMATYGNSATAALEPKTVPFEPPAAYFNRQLTCQLGNLAQGARYMGQIRLPFRNPVDVNAYEQAYAAAKSQEMMAYAQSQGVQIKIDDIYARPICRLWAFGMNGQDYRIAIFATITAEKTTYPMMAGGMLGMGMGGLLGGLGQLGDALGGLFGGQQQQYQQPYGQQQYQQPQWGAPGQAQQIPQATQQIPGLDDDARAAAFCQQQADNTDIGWVVRDYYVLITPAESFDEMFSTVFTDVVSNTKIDEFLQQQKDSLNANKHQNLQVSVQQFQARSQQIAQQSIEYGRQQSAMMDARMESWQRQSDAHHRQVMERSASMFGDSGSGGSMSTADKWSEAILGQNTYVDQYGDEHTVSNRWDEAYRNDAGDIIGVEKGVDPGFGWTKLDKKQ